MTLSFVRDATEQRAAIEAVRASAICSLRSIVESVRDYAIYLLDSDGNIMTWNPGAERIKGYSGRGDRRQAFLALLYPGRPWTAAGRQS